MRTPASWSPPRRPHPREPGGRVHGRHRQGARPARPPRGTRHAIAAVSHGTTVATNQLLEGKVDRLGLHHHRGLRGDARDRPPVGARRLRQLLLLGEARPDRPATSSRASAAGSTSPARRCGRSTRTAPARSPAGSGPRASTRSASASCTPTPTPSTRSGCARCCAEEHPDAVVSLSQRGAARVPRVRARDDHPRRRRREAAALGVRQQHQGRLAAYAGDRKVPFYVMKSNGGVLSADEVVHQPITTVLSGPAAGALGAALIAKVAGFDRVLTSDGGGTSTDVSRGDRRRADAHHRGLGRRVPVEDPDDRRGHRRRRRRLDRLALARGHAQGRPAVGRAPTPGPLCYGKGGTEVTDHRRPRRPRPDPPAPAGRRDPARRRRGPRRRRGAGRQARPHARGLRHRRPGDLRVEPGQRAAPGHGQARPRRPRLHAHHVRRLRLAAAVPADGHPRHPDRAGPAEPRQRLRVRPADRRREERLRADPRLARRAPRRGDVVGGVRRASPRRRPTALAKEGFADEQHSFSAPPTCATSARPSRSGSRSPTAPSTAASSRRRPPASTPSTGALRLRLRRRRHPAGRVGQPAGLRHRPDPAPGDPGPRRPRRLRQGPPRRWRPSTPERSASTPDAGTSTPRCRWPDLAPGVDRSPARRSSRSSARPCRSTPASPPGVDDYLNLIVTRSSREPPRTHPVPVRHLTDDAGAERRPGAGRDRPGLARPRGDGGRDRDRRAPAAAR